jgi:Zn-dependent protease/CBS domain-containing protein
VDGPSSAPDPAPQSGRPAASTPPSGRRDGWEIARLFGVPVYVNASWLVASLVIAFVFTPFVIEQVPNLGALAYLVALAFAVLLGLSVLVHELAHSVTAQAYGYRVRRITLHLLGGLSEIEGDSHRPWPDLVIAFMGPLASLVLAGGFFGLLQVLPTGTVVHLVVWQIAAANLIVGVFNLLPGLPLDGGRIARDLVWALTGRESTGTVVAAWFGRAVAVVLAVLAVLPTIAGSRDFVWLVWGLLLAGFIWVQAGIALRTSRLRSRLPAVTARALTRRAIPVPADTSVAEALRQLDAAQAGGLVTTDRSERPVGIVHEAAVRALPVERRPWVPVSSVSRALADAAPVPVDAVGEDLVSLLQSHPAPEYLVVTADGSIYGVLTYDDVERAVSGLAGRPSGNRA